MKKYLTVCLAALVALTACREFEITPPEISSEETRVTLGDVARLLSSLPIAQGQLDEVHDAVGSSCGNGYDEEYMMRDLLRLPGSGVGDPAEKAAGKRYEKPLRELMTEYLEAQEASRAEGGIAGVQAYLDEGPTPKTGTAAPCPSLPGTRAMAPNPITATNCGASETGWRSGIPS